MSKQNATIILGLILIGAFFLPYLSGNGVSISGFKIVFGKGGLFGNTKGTLTFLVLLIPIGGLLALFSTGSGSYSGLSVWLPLIGVAYLAIRLYMELNKVVDSLSVSRFISALGYGFWISLVASVLLLVNNDRREYASA